MSDPARKQGLLICLSGPSGVGKGTVIREIRRCRPDIAHSISITTRAARPGEVEGVHYYYRSQEQFDQMIAEGEILEHDGYCGNYYGTPRTPLTRMLDEGHDVLMDITVPGSLAIMAAFPEAITLFLMPPSLQELRRRLETRGTECCDVVERRLSKARDEIGKARFFQYMVTNDTLSLAVDRILAIITAEHCRYERNSGIETQVLNN